MASTTDVTRYASKFTSIDGTVEVVFPTDEIEYQSAQNYRAVLSSIPGANYGVDHQGGRPWTKDFGEEALRFVIWGDTGAGADADFDELTATCYEIGEGKLWAVDQAGTLRWCYANVSARPNYQSTARSYTNIPVAVRFIRKSDWMASSQTTVQTTPHVTTAVREITVNNPGNAVAYWLQIYIDFGFSNPKVMNLTNGYSIQVSRNYTPGGASGLLIDAETGRVQYTEDGGANYFDAYDLATLGDTQVGLFALDPGDNTIRIENDAPPGDCIVEFDFYAPFH